MRALTLAAFLAATAFVLVVVTVSSDRRAETQ